MLSVSVGRRQSVDLRTNISSRTRVPSRFLMSGHMASYMAANTTFLPNPMARSAEGRMSLSPEIIIAVS